MLQNLHTHTIFCDGKDSPEDMIKQAIELEFSSLGFSSHAPTCIGDNCEMKDVEKYIKAVKSLREDYSDKIEVLLGIELDYYSAGIVDTNQFEYKIGSVHYSKIGDEILYYDFSKDKTKWQIDNVFSGDGIAYAASYYERLAGIIDVMTPDFIGHFDLVTKFSEIDPSLIDTDSKEYRSIALEALHALSEKIEFFEVNTGAISRGYRKTPYPAPFILDEMKKIGAKLVLTSDCHKKEYLDICFKESKELIKAHGFDKLYYLTKNGFVGEKF